jgi:hypothetical protein
LFTRKGFYIVMAVIGAFVLAASVILGVTLGRGGKDLRANVSDLKFADLRNATVVLNAKYGQNVSKVLDGGYVYFFELGGGPGGGSNITGSYGPGGKAMGWFDARKTGDLTIYYWVGMGGGGGKEGAGAWNSSVINKPTPSVHPGGAGGLGYVAGTKGSDGTDVINWATDHWGYNYKFGAGGGGSSAIVFDDVCLLQAKGGNGVGPSGTTNGAGGVVNDISGVESMDGMAAYQNASGGTNEGYVKITRYDASTASNILAGFAGGSVTGNGAGVTQN